LKRKRSIPRFIAFSLLLFAWALLPYALAQMPDWILVRDPDGNRYHVDPNGRIYTSGKPEFDFKPVSEDGLNYYYNQGVELLKAGYRVEGLALLKSILAMPDGGRTRDFRARASMEINGLIRREGDRYEALNRKASVLLYRWKGSVVLINDLMKYRVELPAGSRVLRTRMRGDDKYGYYGLLIGMRFDGDMTALATGACDALVAIDSERFPSEFRTMGELKKNWARNLGADTFRRTTIRSDKRAELARFEDGTLYAGYEAFLLRGRYGYCIRIISAVPQSSPHGPDMEKVINSFRTSFVER